MGGGCILTVGGCPADVDLKGWVIQVVKNQLKGDMC